MRALPRRDDLELRVPRLRPERPSAGRRSGDVHGDSPGRRAARRWSDRHRGRTDDGQGRPGARAPDSTDGAVHTDDGNWDRDGDHAVDADADADADPVEPAETVGLVYSFALEDATIEKPSGLGTLIDGQLNQSIVVEVQAADALTMDLLVGLSAADTSDEQDYCAATTSLTDASFAENPSFSVGPSTLSISAQGITLTLEDVYLSGTFSADLSEITNGELSALMDTEPLDALAEEYGADSACTLLSYIGASCVDCADGEETCVEFVATKMLGEGVKMDLVEIQGNYCDGCETGVPEIDAVCY